MKHKTVMPYDTKQTCFTDQNEPTNENFYIKDELYDEYKQALLKGFVGTYEQYLQRRDYV